jgi:hypothetical protein
MTVRCDVCVNMCVYVYDVVDRCVVILTRWFLCKGDDLQGRKCETKESLQGRAPKVSTAIR